MQQHHFENWVMGIALFGFAGWLTGCSDRPEETREKGMDTTIVREAAPPQPAYDAAMDPYLMGGAGVKPYRDTLGVKVYEAVINPGDSFALHQHPDHTVYVMEGGTLSLSLNGGPVTEMVLEKGAVMVGGPLSDAGWNSGKSRVRLLVHDIYRPRNP